jgi:hypothetical protein
MFVERKYIIWPYYFLSILCLSTSQSSLYKNYLCRPGTIHSHSTPLHPTQFSALEINYWQSYVTQSFYLKCHGTLTFDIVGKHCLWGFGEKTELHWNSETIQYNKSFLLSGFVSGSHDDLDGYLESVMATCVHAKPQTLQISILLCTPQPLRRDSLLWSGRTRWNLNHPSGLDSWNSETLDTVAYLCVDRYLVGKYSSRYSVGIVGIHCPHCQLSLLTY